jgi:hypothetical protein
MVLCRLCCAGGEVDNLKTLEVAGMCHPSVVFDQQHEQYC